MADYQLIGDSFAYHAGYPPNSSQQNAALGASQPGQPGLGMLPGSVPPGQQSYHPLQAPRPGYPQTDPLMSHKMHPGYPGYPGAVPPSAAATSSAIRSQYSQSYMPHASMDSYASLSMGQPPPHLSAAGQSLGAAYGQHQNLMGQYPGQRMHTPSPLHATPRHPSMPSQYASTYGSSSQTAPSYHSSGSSELWSSGQNISLQQTPFSSFQSTAAGPPSSAPSSSSLHSSRTAGQFAPGADPYGTSSSNPYFSNHLSTDSPYPPGYPSVSSTQSQSTSSRSSASSRSQQQQQQQQQQQYSSQLGPYSATPASSISAQAGSQTATNSVSSNSAARFSHYSAYPQSMPFDPSSQARLSPYPTPTPNSGGSQTPNSPQYRSTGGYPQGGSTPASQLPVLSPRRPTATPPAGSPMPPTSHTPGPPSVGSNHSTQGTTPGSAFSIATPGSGHHLSNSSSSTAPSSLQQLEQMVMPHLGSSSSSNSSAAATSKSLATSASNSTSTFFPGANANSSPISPQSQQSQQSKLFPSHFAASSPSTQSPQYPYHQYSQQAPPPGNTVQWQPATGQMSSASSQLNTHPLKPSAMIQPPHHGASHSASAKSHQASESALHQPYSTYGSSSKASNDLTSAPDSGESYSQSFASSSNSHSSPSTSSISVSHSTLPQSGYNNISNSLPSNSGLSSYESLTTPKQQSSLKNDTQQLFDPSKGSRSVLEPLPGDPMNPMAGQQSQMTSLNSNSYHTMMQQSYSSQAMSAYSSQSRFDHPMSNQYGGMSSELTNSAYDHSGPDSSMMSYDPYNIDNALSMAPPHQSMSEYRESQANMQQSGNDYAQNDPYAANFDDFETTSKRKGKGRPKKDASAAPAVKKERKPRQPRAPSTRGAGRGRGRGAKNVAERVPIPGMMPDFSDSPVVPYGAPPLGPPGPESLDMYSSSVDMYSPLAGGKMAVPVSMPMEPSMMTSQNSLNPTVLSSQPPPSADLSSPYGPPPSQPPPPQPPAPSQLLSNSLPPPPMAPLQPPVSSPFEQQQMPPSMPEPTSYPSFVPDSISSEPSAPPAPICDNKELSQENKPAAPPNYDDRYLPPPPSADTPVNNANDTLLTGNLVNAESNIVPSMSGAAAAVSAPNNTDVDMIDVDKSQMSFNSSMETNCSSLAQPTSVQPPPLPPASSAAPCMPSTLPQESSTYSSNSMQDNNVGNLEPAPIEVSELANEKAVVVPSSFGDVSSMQSMVSVPPPSHLMPPIPPSISQIPPPTDYNSVPYYVPEDPSLSQMHSFAASTPIVDAKAKKPKKRRSKKDDSIVEDEAGAIKDDSASEKPKKKRAKKVKAAPAVMDDSLGIDNSSVFSSLELTDDKTQLSTFDSTISSEIDTPKPKARGKKKAAKKVIKSEPIESDVNVTEDITAAADLNGDASLEVAEEKPKKPKVKSKSPKKKMPKLALKLKQNKKRRRGFGSPDNSDIERTPPPSPSPEDDSNKRRSARNTKRQRYNDDLDLDLSDDDFMDKKKNEDSNVVNVQLTEDTMVVEKILTSRMAKRELEIEPCDDQKENGANVPEEPVFIDVEEFYVKYKNLSYLHCDWKTEDELEKGDRRIAQKIKRYKQKKDVNVFDFLDEEPFNPDYVEVDRVLDVNEIEEIVDDDEEEEAEEMKPNAKDENKSLADVKPKTESEEGNSELNENGKSDNEIADADRESESAKVKEDGGEATEEAKPETTDKSDIKEEDNVEVDTKTKTEEVAAAPAKEKKKKTRIVRHFLVKWRGLSYEESTWELEDDIDPAKIDHFYKFRNPPPRNEWKIKKRPKASEWKKKDESTVYKNGNTLREYQLEGVNWLSFCWHNGQNCILADEMGLGKTIQSITFVQEMVDYGIPYPYLIIVPLSTIGNWQREFETWTDLNVVTYHGSSPSRNMLQEYELYYKNEKNERIPNVYKFQVMITTFEVILSDCLELSQIKWVACIIDEAHRLKNRNCKLLEGLRMLSIDHRVLLSGTPLQNNVEELYSLLHFLEPSQFASNENFLTEFGDLKTEAQVDKLKAILKPMMLRRLKEDVEKSLAPKEETIIEVELTNVQKKYYRAILERNFAFLSKGGTYANMPNLMNTVMELRKCCIHPFLINGAEEQILQEYKQQHNDDGTISAIIQASGKLVLIDKLLPRLKENGHRVLIFSQMVRCLDILEDYLCQRRYPYERIDGRVRGNLRQAAIDRFSKPDSDRFVFLLCTRAGGLGINLTAADTVIIFDSDWNPQNDLQAQARCHRIGQKKSVKVYRLICRNTYEREMFDRASLKLGLDKAVLQSINAQRSNLPDNQLSKKEIEDLLRKGAYGALMDDDNAGDKFCEEDIDIILQRRTTKIIIESEGKGGSFSKASFATSDNRTDIEIDDPNFWEKWAKKANFDIDELKNRNELIVQEPRRRTQTKRFGADDAMLDITDLETSTDDEEAISMRTRGSRNRPLIGGKSKKRKGRGNYDPDNDEDYAQEVGFGWSRYEFFRVEKALLTYGWGRWDECLKMANFKRELHEQDVEDISRIVLLFSLQNYKGDEKVKSYVLELITPPSEKNASASETEAGKSLEANLFNDVGTCGGRRGKKAKVPIKSVGEELETLDWARNEKYNPEVHLPEEYRKHLLRHANKLLLRVRLLTYIKNEIIGDLHDKVISSTHVRDIPIPYCQPDTDPPVGWWDEEADKSLLIGVYKHGYDRFNLMRTDEALCFLSRCGPPDGAALLAELSTEFDEGKTLEEDEPDTPATPATPQVDVILKEERLIKEELHVDGQEVKVKDEKADQTLYLPFPNGPELNNRLRRLATSYQRNFKKEEARIAQKARHQQRIERIEKFEAVMRAKEQKKREQAQKKWSRREEADFYRIVSSFGVDYNRKTETFDWGRFRMYAKLERKLDDTLTEYFKAFYAMCKKVVGRQLTEDDENLPISVDPITEEKANRCLARIDLLSKVREEIIYHPELEERLKLCQPQLDLPDWWICGKHDRDLLLGVAKYGFFRLDFNLMNDPELSFMEVIRNYDNPTPLEVVPPEKKSPVDVVECEVKSIVSSLIEQVDSLSQSSLAESSDDTDKKEREGTDEKSEETKMEVDEAIDEDKQKDSAETSSDEKAAKSDSEQSEAKSEEKLEKLVKGEMEAEEGAEAKPLTNGEHGMGNHEFILKPMESEIGAMHSTALLSQPKGSFKWPRDRVLQLRLENVCVAVEKNEWPSFRGMSSICMQHSTTPSIATADSSPRPSTPCSLSSASQEHTPHPTPDHTPRRESQSPFTGDYNFYSNNSAATINSNLLNSFENDSTRRRRRRRRRFEMENDRNNKLHSLLNAQFEQPATHSAKQQQQQQSSSSSSGQGSKQQYPSSISVNAANNALNSLASSLFAKNAKNQPNSLFNNLPSQFLPLLSNLPPGLRNVLRDTDLFNDEKSASILLGNTLAAAAAASAKSKSTGLDSKGNLSGPPPAHQSSSSRNSLPGLSTLDLTAKFKNASNSVLEKAAAMSTGRSNHPYPAHKPMNKNMLSEKAADVLDLSSMASKYDAKSAMSNLLSQSLKQSIEQKNSAFLAQQQQQQQSLAAGKKKGRTGSRIDALALNLQAKKMMEEVKQVDTATSLVNRSQQLQQQQQAAASASRMAKGFNDKELLAALTNLGGDKRNSMFFDEFSKQAALHSNKAKNQMSASSSASAAAAAAASTAALASMMKKSTADANKSQMSFLDSLKLLTSKNPKDSASFIQKNLKSMLEEHPELLASASNASLTSLLSSPLLGHTSNLASLSSQSPSSLNLDDKKQPPSRTSKRSRAQFDLPNTSMEEPQSKRAMLAASKSPFLDPKNANNFKYLSTLLDGKNEGIEAKIKNLINQQDKSANFKDFKTPVSMSSSAGSSMRTRTSDKRASASSSSTSFANLNASNLLNSLSMAAASASGTPTSKQQQTAASLLANSYANAFGSNANKSSSSNMSNSTASQFANFAGLGNFNPSMLANSFPSMKMFLDAAAAAAAAGVSKSSAASNSNTSSTTTSSSSAASTSTSASSMSSFANLLGGMNPLLNFSNLANLSALGQAATKKDNTGVDFASLFANANSLAANLVGDDKSKSTKTSSASASSSSSNSNSNKGKTGLSPAAAAAMLGSSGLGSSLPFLYSNPNFNPMSLYNPLSLGSFGLSSPFLNNPNLMNGLANFSNVFTSTTSTMSSSSNQASTASSKPRASATRANTKVASSKASASAASGLSLASSLHAGSSSTHTAAANSTTLDSDDESLKSLLGNDDEDDLNGDFESEHVDEPKSSRRSRSSANKPQSTPPKEGKPKRSTTSK